MLEQLPMNELPKEKIHAAVVRIDERISQEVWRSVLQFMYQGTLHPEHCAYLKDIGKCVELLRAVLLYKLPEPLLRLAQSYLFPMLPGSSPSHALQVFALCASDENKGNKDLQAVCTGAAWVLLHHAHTIFEDIEATDLCESLTRVVQALEQSVFATPEQRPTVQDHLEQSMHMVPQDLLSQTLSATTRGFGTGYSVQDDYLSHSGFRAAGWPCKATEH
ncbi:unnamed protein product [Effrenium voratum]|nr:unnamed protein product [Effrenium voratum]